VTRYVLDTSFLVDHLRGDAAATSVFRDRNEAGDEFAICAVSAAETWSGRPSERDAVDILLRYLEFLQPGPATARLAGGLRAAARERGRTLALPDALIAATAIHLDATVLTRNVRDFELTPARVEVY
jgi:predicted nucleic acid-binding protein